MRFPITRGTLNLTQACNLACSYCFTGGKSNKKMTFELAKKIIDFLFFNAEKGNRKAIEITFWGGEPLLEWELIKKIVRYVESVKNGIKADFGGTTNGTLLTEEKLKFFDDHGGIAFMVSLDGTPDTHNRYRTFHDGGGSQAVIMRNLEKALKYCKGYRVRMSPYAEGIHRFYDDVVYLVSHGIGQLMFSPVYESGWTEEKWMIWEEQCHAVVDLIAEKKKKGFDFDIAHFRSYTGPDHSHWPCGAGRDYVGFDLDGALYPCHRFSKFSDIRPWHLKPMVIGHVDYGVTDHHLRSQFINFLPSSGCQWKDCFESTPCHGGCYAVNYDMTGNIHTAPSVLCRYVEMQKRVSSYYIQKMDFKQKLPAGKPCACHFEFYCGPVS